MLDTPVAMIIFRRPEFTTRVLERIARAAPRRLLVIADGPSPDRPGEADLCAATRAVIETVNWDCQVQKFYSDTNQGVATYLSAGLRWVFEQVENAIVLEDDEVPDTSFFHFCSELLDRYRDDPRVMAINGTNLQLGQSVTPYSYYFSNYFHCWGFASWRRAFANYDVKLSSWPRLRDSSWLMDIASGNAPEAAYFRECFDGVHCGRIQTWDYQVTYAMWAQNGLAITPDVNLVSNIGHGSAGYYCRDASNPFANLPTVPMPFPLHHPSNIARDAAADRREYANNIEPVLKMRARQTSFLHRLWPTLSRRWRGIFK